jgi:tetratricopeptide (TPR) repeat protein
MPAAQDTIFNEAQSAMQAGDRGRARDLLTRLLKTTQDNPDYWVWMSAVVETSKERIFCLNQALKLDPEHIHARRGLTLMGQMTPDDSLVLPARLQKRSWQGKAQVAAEPVPGMAPALQMGLAGIGLVVVGLVLFFVFGNVMKPAGQATTQAAARRWDTETPVPSQTVVLAAAAGTKSPPSASTPLWLLLDATYTPTPLYVVTPHPASVSEAYKYGIRAYTRGDWASVDRFMKQVLTSEPGAVDARYYMADALRLQGQYPQALKAFNDIISSDPGFAPAYLGRARTRLGSGAGSLESARADLETAIKNDPYMAEAYLELVSVLIEADQFKEAAPFLEQAAPLLPDSPLIFVYRAEINMLAKDYEQALADAERALQLDQTSLPAYLVKGEALAMTGQLQAALDALTIYTNYVKDDARAWLWVGLAHDEAGDKKQALQAYDQALRLNNRLLEALINRAQIYLDDKNGDSALEDYRAVLRLEAESFEASMGVGKALMLLDYPGDAYMQFERTQSLAKDDQQKGDLLYWRALSLEELGEMEVALREWKKLLVLPKDSLSAEIRAYASQRVQVLASPTPTAKPPTATRTVAPTNTRVPSRTPAPSETARVTATSTLKPASTATLRPTSTP